MPASSAKSKSKKKEPKTKPTNEENENEAETENPTETGYFILGIDEAGRGPVLGPLVYGTVFCPVEKEGLLKEFKVDDSKVLSAAKREAIFKKLNDAKEKEVYYITKKVSALELSEKMQKKMKISLNKISHDCAVFLVSSAIKMLKELHPNDETKRIKKVYVDTVGPEEKYAAYLQSFFPDIEFHVEKRADSTFPTVSAASICAKVTRDAIIEEISSKLNEKIGSGYPGDPATKKYLNNSVDSVFGWNRFVRFSWKTAQNLLKTKACQVEWEDDDNLGSSSKKKQKDKNQPTLFAVSNSNKPKFFSTPFFADFDRVQSL